jgi:hypothetical protein
VKSVTVSVPDDVYQKASVEAAKLGTSVSALVRGYLESLCAGEGECERLSRAEHLVRERIAVFDASERLSRDLIHGRGVGQSEIVDPFRSR